MTNERPRRAQRPLVVLEVLENERVSEHLVRLTLGGDGFDDYQDRAATDKYIKILFADPALGLEMPYDLDALRETLPPEKFPVRRTYTVRRVNPDARTLQVEFVVHGSDGIAGPWALAAKPGDKVCFGGPGGMFQPDPEADWHLFAGDETAIPAMEAAFEAMSADARGLAYVEIGGPEDEIDLGAPAGIEVRWLHRGGEFTPDNTVLADAVEQGPWFDGDVQVFVHGEREVMKRLRTYIYNERGVDRKRMSLSAYWAYGRAEETFQAEKSEAIGQIFDAEAAPAAS